MATISGVIQDSMKDNMLTELKDFYNYALVATDSSDNDVSDTVNFAFDNPSGGSMGISSNITLTVNSGETVNKLFVVNRLNPSIGPISFTLDTPIDFPNGGNLIVSQLDVVLADA